MKHRDQPFSDASVLPEDLSVLERREQLSGPMRHRLELCLASSKSLQALHELGRRFDEVPAELPEDGAILRRIAARSVERFANEALPSSNNAWRNAKVAWLTAAAFLLGTLGAAAALYPALHSRARPLAPVSTGNASQPRQPSSFSSRVVPAVNHSPASPVSVTGVASGSASSASIASSAPILNTEPPRSSVETTRIQGSGSESLESASGLFSAANAARRKGDLARALALYRDLQQRYPGAGETLLSHMMLGRLELSRGNAHRALVGYEAYLKRAPNGTLAQEALQGKAEALHRLGRRVEEHASWRELLRRFPASAYTEAAQEHLIESP
jgi:TolA-binding protein